MSQTFLLYIIKKLLFYRKKTFKNILLATAINVKFKSIHSQTNKSIFTHLKSLLYIYIYTYNVREKIY